MLLLAILAHRPAKEAHLRVEAGARGANRKVHAQAPTLPPAERPVLALGDESRDIPARQQMAEIVPDHDARPAASMGETR